MLYSDAYSVYAVLTILEIGFYRLAGSICVDQCTAAVQTHSNLPSIFLIADGYPNQSSGISTQNWFQFADISFWKEIIGINLLEKTKSLSLFDYSQNKLDQHTYFIPLFQISISVSR